MSRMIEDGELCLAGKRNRFMLWAVRIQ